MNNIKLSLFLPSNVFRLSARKHGFSFLLLASYFSLLPTLLSQTNYAPVPSSVYNFLERMSGKGIIQLNEEIKPFSRMYISDKLNEIHQSSIAYRRAGIINHNSSLLNNQSSMNNHQSRISDLEREELEFYIREYASELRRLGFDLSEYEVNNKLIDLKSDNFGFDKYNRFRILSYDTDEFGLFIDPVLSYEYHNNDAGSWWSYSNGVKLHGFLGENVGFDLQFYDNHPRGKGFDWIRTFSPVTGFEFRNGKDNGFDYDRMNANLNFSWDYVTISLGKDFNYYGSGEDGKIILSDKAPSFPNLKLEVYPTDWFKFSYILGSLQSRILDSTTNRYGELRSHISTVEKYLATHLISFTPLKNLNFSLGESVIFSDRFEPIYLIPIAFFRFADHYYTFRDETAGNAQLFASFWYKNYWLRTKLYGSIFIDELTTYEKNNNGAFGYNIGFKTIDPFIPESEFILEYSRLNPFVYFHADRAQTFANYDYEMGHWIGSNADEIYTSFRKRIIRGLNLDIWYRYIRKGNEESYNEQTYQDYHKFLWGDKISYTYYGAEICYEIVHDFKALLNYQYVKISGDNIEEYSNSTFSFALRYGI